MPTTSPRGRGRTGRTPVARTRRPGPAARPRRRRRVGARARPRCGCGPGFVFIARGAVVLRGPAGAAPGRRAREVRHARGVRRAARSPSSCRPTAARSSTATASRSPTSVDGRMVVADPLDDRGPGPPSWRASWPQRLHVDYFTTLRALSQTDSRFAYIARRVPAVAGGRTSSTRRPQRRLQGAGHPQRPGPVLPRPRRRRQPGRLHGHRRPAGRARARLRPAAGRHRRLGDLRGRRRQPDPAREAAPSSRPTTAPTCTPPSTRTCSGTPSGCCARPCSGARGDSGLRGRDGLPQR